MANSKVITLAQFKEELYISYSQIFTYLTCSLKYMFQYVQAQPPERISIALPFGKSIHKALEHYYRTYMDKQEIVVVERLEEVFADSFTTALLESSAPVIHKKGETKDSMIQLGREMLIAFHRATDAEGIEVVGVEVPMSARLYNENGERTQFNLVGVIDLLVKNNEKRIIAIDHKTAKNAKSQKEVDADLQCSSYAYLLASNRVVEKSSDVLCEMNVLRKLKKPKIETLSTIRTPTHRKRFAKIACAILKAIDHGIFIPSKGWMCADCQYQDACRDW